MMLSVFGENSIHFPCQHFLRLQSPLSILHPYPIVGGRWGLPSGRVWMDGLIGWKPTCRHTPCVCVCVCVWRVYVLWLLRDGKGEEFSLQRVFHCSLTTSAHGRERERERCTFQLQDVYLVPRIGVGKKAHFPPWEYEVVCAYWGGGGGGERFSEWMESIFTRSYFRFRFTCCRCVGMLSKVAQHTQPGRFLRELTDSLSLSFCVAKLLLPGPICVKYWQSFPFFQLPISAR